MSRPINLNHAQISHIANGWAMALLLLGGALSGAVFWQYLHLNSEISALQAELQQLAQLKQKPRTTKVSTKGNAQSTAMVAAIAEIKTPWTSLFKALEAANHADIKLLSLEPNAKTKQIRLNAVAFNVDSMMAYINRLNAQATLQQVRLLSQEAGDINGTPAINFKVEAVWQPK